MMIILQVKRAVNLAKAERRLGRWIKENFNRLYLHTALGYKSPLKSLRKASKNGLWFIRRGLRATYTS